MQGDAALFLDKFGSHTHGLAGMSAIQWPGVGTSCTILPFPPSTAHHPLKQPLTHPCQHHQAVGNALESNPGRPPGIRPKQVWGGDGVQ